MSIHDMVADAAKRQAELDRLRNEALQRAAHSKVNIAGLSEEARGLLDRVDLADRKRLDAQTLEAASSHTLPRATRCAVGFGLVTLAAIACDVTHVASSTGCYIVGLAAGTVAGFSLVIRSGAKYNVGWAQREQQTQSNSMQADRRQLGDLAREGRAASERQLLERLRDAGAAGKPVDALLNDGAGWVVMQHVGADPFVAQAAMQARKIEDGVTHKGALLAGTRADLFAGEPERMRQKWGEVGQGAGALWLLGTIAASLGLGIGAGRLTTFHVGLGVGAAVALGSCTLAKRMVTPLIARRVEIHLRRELSAEVARERPQVEPRRNALIAVRDESLAHYTAFLRSNPVPPPLPGNGGGDVHLDDGDLMVGGVRVKRNDGAPAPTEHSIR